MIFEVAGEDGDPGALGPVPSSAELCLLAREKTILTWGDARQRQRRGHSQLTRHGGYTLSELFRAEALLGCRLARLLDDQGERAEQARHREGLSGPGHESAQSGIPGERHIACDGLHRHQGQRVDIGSPIERGPHQLFGRRVPGRAQHGPEGLCPTRFRQRSGDAEIGHADVTVFVKEQVRRLDVTMHQTSSVGIGKGRGDIQPEGRHLRDAQPMTAVQQGAQAASLQKLHRQIGVAGVLAPVIDTHDALVT